MLCHKCCSQQGAAGAAVWAGTLSAHAAAEGCAAGVANFMAIPLRNHTLKP